MEARRWAVVVVFASLIAGCGRGTAAPAGPALACGEGVPPAGVAASPSFGDFWRSVLGRMLAAGEEPSPQDRRLVIDLNERTITLFVKGQKVKTYPVAIGTEEDPSPVGEFQVVHKDRDWGDGFGPRWMGLNVPWGIYGIHGTNKPWSIGTRASHGCFRMYNEDVIELFPEVPLGTPVDIVGPDPEYVPRDLYEPGENGQDVVVLQFLLRRAGWNSGRADGRYGDNVVAAVKQAEAFYGLPVDGQAGRDLQWLLGLRHEGEESK
ncbi:MAG: L,D-transpeptidase family protein [Firmicutes bacterium]|nr:L,D-transpeptidase family protein [Bacillota bacterium]